MDPNDAKKIPDSASVLEDLNKSLPQEEQRQAFLRMAVKGLGDWGGKQELARFIDAVLFLELLTPDSIVDKEARCLLDAFCSKMIAKMMISVSCLELTSG